MSKQKILFLGEGDFSFTYAFLCRLTDVNQDNVFDVVSTSYDSANEVLTKYPHAKKLLGTFEKEKERRIRICHGIDATKSLVIQLSIPPATTGSVSEAIDHVIFNFPHLGVEDCKSHSSLVAHIFHRVRQLFEETNSSPHASFYLTLAEGQAERWNIMDMAQRTGMVCYASIPFSPQLWHPHYQLRRHHTGQSFQRRIGSSIHYCFRRRCAIDGDDVEGGLNVFSFLATAVAHVAAVAAPVPQCIDAPVGNSNAVIVKKKQRKVDALVTGSYCHRQEVAMWECLTCHKQMTTEQGVKTHVYKVHFLSNGSKQPQNDESITPPVMQAASLIVDGDAKPIMCVECGKSFPNEDAMFQHNVAKHSGVYKSLRPAWSAHGGAPDTTTALCTLKQPDDTHQLLECDICGWCFDDATKLASHMEGWAPIAENKYGFECVNCRSTFASERALHQHENFCVNRTTANDIKTKT